MREKDALDQAGLALVLLEASKYGGQRYAEAAGALVEYIATHLFESERGCFRGRQVGVTAATGTRGWWTDPVVYADRCALLIRACAAAARHLQDERAGRMARAAGNFLLEHNIDAEGAVYHFYVDGASEVSGLLEDQVLVSAALLDLYELSGEQRFRERARETIGFMEEHNFDPERQAFFDRPDSVEIEGLVSPLLFPYVDGMLPAGNALAAELYVQLGDLDRAGALLAGKRLTKAPGRASSSYARAILLCDRIRSASL